jgi:dCTP deaminase
VTVDQNVGVLPDHEIERLCWPHASPPERVLIRPYNPTQLSPSSYDVRVDRKILVPNMRQHRPIDLGKPAPQGRMDEVNITGGYMLVQGRFVLASTVEWVDVPDDMVCRLEGKSSLARLGLQIHSAGYIDPGFAGNITLEIVNLSEDPVILRYGVLIGQLSFQRMSSAARKPYSKTGRYGGSRGPRESLYGHSLSAATQVIAAHDTDPAGLDET